MIDDAMHDATHEDTRPEMDDTWTQTEEDFTDLPYPTTVEAATGPGWLSWLCKTMFGPQLSIFGKI